jgi:biopolymer transport protein ExbB
LILLTFLLPKKVSKRYKSESTRSGDTSATGFPQSYPQKLWLIQNAPYPLSRTDSKSPAAGLIRHKSKTPRWAIITRHSNLERSLTLFSIIQAAGWSIWPLIACSILALALVIERFISLKTLKVAPPKLLEEVITVTQKGVPGPDVVSTLEKNSALGEILASGLRMLNTSPRCSEDELRSAMESTGRLVGHRLERYLSALATIASAAPLMGLFGTVVGMIEIFGSQAPTGGNPAQLAHGISVALYNTAFGLIVAIPSLIFWRYFRARVDAYLLTLELSAERMAHHLNTLRK